MEKPFSFETFLKILENDDRYHIDETSFYFDDDSTKEEHMLGCIRGFDKPYWVGYCDIPNGCEFYSASELLTARIFDGKSIKDRWEHLVFINIGGIGTEDWLSMYSDII